MRHLTIHAVIAAAVALAGVCRAAPDDYMVIDLSAGIGGNYSITYTNEVPGGAWTNEHKTSKLVLHKIPRGTFIMGSPTNEVGRATDGSEDQRSVTLPDDYYIGVFEVTEGQYRRVRSTSWPDTTEAAVNNHGAPDYSSFFDTFLTQFNNGTTNALNNALLKFELPTEQQWEYACRAGSATAYYYGSDATILTNYAWYSANSFNNPQPVGRKIGNDLSLFDMHGNVEEPCRTTNNSYVLRGGGVRRAAVDCRSAYRGFFSEGETVGGGFRLCLTLPTQYYAVTVTNGTAEVASGTNGQVVAICANPPAAETVFDRWTGDTQTVQNVYASNTTVRIQGASVAVTATYRAAPYTLTVYSGSGSGQYASGDLVFVSADAPAPGQAFDYWSKIPGDAPLGPSFNPFSATTWITMPPLHTILVANYAAIPTYTLTVNGGTGSGSYTNGQTVAIAAAPPPAHHTFLWTGAIGTVADVTAWETTLVMPAAAVTVNATYPPILYPLTVSGGLGSGSYTNGQAVTVTATNLPSAGHTFDVWSGDTNGLADVFAPTTTVTVAGAAALTPTYRPILMPNNTYMVVDLTASQPSQAVSYRDDVPAGGWTGAYQTNKMVLRKIPSGSFLMGSPAAETGRQLDETRHSVTLTKVFYIGLFEVTQAQWFRVKGNWPSFWSNAVDRLVRPVERVSYVQIRGATNSANWPHTAAVESGSFIGQLREKTGDTAFDLPTEAQWEYACRAGTAGKFSGTGVLSAMGWFSGNNTNYGTKAVGYVVSTNAWGLYDTHGNVHEICLDWYAGDYSPTNQIDPHGAVGSLQNRRIMRGGWYNAAENDCRSAYRGNLLPTNQWAFAGLRVARTAAAVYGLTVVNGLVNTGGLYSAGTQISISPARGAGWRTFLRWEVEPAGVSLGGLFDASQADTVVTQPAQAVKVTARYQTRCMILVL